MLPLIQFEISICVQKVDKLVKLANAKSIDPTAVSRGIDDAFDAHKAWVSYSIFIKF